MGEFLNFLGHNLLDFWNFTGYANATVGHWVMLAVGLFFIYLAVSKEFEPMLLIPIGFGILVGNIPFNLDAGLKVGIYEDSSVFNILYGGVTNGWYPPLIFLGIGAMTDFSALATSWPTARYLSASRGAPISLPLPGKPRACWSPTRRSSPR